MAAGGAWRRRLLQGADALPQTPLVLTHTKQEGAAMKRPAMKLIYHGWIGGILAGLVVVLWCARDRLPLLANPSSLRQALASALYHVPFEGPSFRLVRCTRWCISGCSPSSVLRGLGDGRAGRAPRLLLGVSSASWCRSCSLYGVVPQRACRHQDHPWQHVIGANLVSGIVLMAYLHRASRAELPFGLAQSNSTRC